MSQALPCSSTLPPRRRQQPGRSWRVLQRQLCLQQRRSALRLTLPQRYLTQGDQECSGVFLPPGRACNG